MLRIVRFLSLLFTCSFASAVLAQSADLSVTMTMPPTAAFMSVDASANGHFTVTNAGPSIAQNVTIDLGTDVSSSTYPTGFTCGPANGRYLCTAPAMIPGTVSGTFVTTWPWAANGTVETTTVKITSSSTPDPDTTNNSSSANTTVVWQTDLQLTDMGSPFPAAPGGYLSLYVNYWNKGPSPATDFNLTISIPPGAAYDRYVASDSSEVKCTEPPKGGHGDLVCSASSVGPGQDQYVEVIARVDPAATPGSVLTFPATLTSSDAIIRTQTKSGSVAVVQAADLHAEISAPASATSGTTFPTTITVTNPGPGPALQTTVSYSQSGGVISALYGPMTGPAGWSCSTRSCTIASFPPGTATFTIPTAIPGNLKSGTLTGQVTASTPSDPNFADNVVKAGTVVVPPPQATLKLTLTASPDPVYSGDQLTYTAQIANTSNVDAQDVRLDWGQLNGTVVAASCGATSNTQCTFATIAAGVTQTVTRTIHVDAGAGTALTAYFIVGATNVIPDDQTDSAFLSTTVAGTPHVDLEPVISTPLAVRAGATASWSYSIRNHGPDTATDWQLTIPLPPNTQLANWGSNASYMCSGLTLNAVNTQVICHGTSISPLLDIVLYLTVTPGTTTPIHATAIVSTANVDPTSQNDTVAVDTPIITSAQLSASITADKTAAVTGERVTQTFTVTNNGPDAATGVVLDIDLPTGAGFSTMSSKFASCTGTAPIHCVAPTLAAGDALSATIAFQAPAALGVFQTEAYATWDNSGNAHAFTSLQVIAPPSASDVTVAVDATPAAVPRDGTVTYTLSAANVGSSAASNVTVQFNLPQALTFLSSSPQCTGTTAITCTAGTLSGGAWAMFTVTARAVAAGTITASANVSTTSPEANLGNNSATATIVVNAVPQVPPARRRAARH